MTKPVYYQVEQRAAGKWKPVETGRLLVLSGTFRDLLDSVAVTEYQRIRKLDPAKVPSDWVPTYVCGKVLKKVVTHQKEWAKLPWWKRLLYTVLPFANPHVSFVNLVTKEATYRHVCRNLKTELTTYSLLFHQLDDEGTYENVPHYLKAWRDKAREGDAEAACRLLVCRSEQGHDGEFLDVYWSNHGTK
jgi:hypothetical protein